MKVEFEIKEKIGQLEDLKIARFKQHIRKTNPHKHNHYLEIVYLTNGSGIHTVDMKAYKIEPPIVFTIRKEQFHFWEIEGKPDGFVLIIRKSYLENCFDKEMKGLISELSSHTCLLQVDSAVIHILNILLREFEHGAKANSILIDGLLKAALAKMLESAKPSELKTTNSISFQRFQEHLSDVNHLNNKVNHYAQLMNTTPQNLNAICRREVGLSASTILAEHLVNEAKRQLIYTDFSISEIAHKLNFKDNSHFSKYFKRHVGQTPISFRKRNQ